MPNHRFVACALAAAALSMPASAAILVDYDDGIANGVHDTSVLDGDFDNQTDASFAPWVQLGTGAP